MRFTTCLQGHWAVKDLHSYFPFVRTLGLGGRYMMDSVDEPSHPHLRLDNEDYLAFGREPLPPTPALPPPPLLWGFCLSALLNFCCCCCLRLVAVQLEAILSWSHRHVSSPRQQVDIHVKSRTILGWFEPACRCCFLAAISGSWLWLQ